MIEREDRDRIRILYFNNPPANTLTLEALQSLRREAEAAAADPSVRCLVLASRLPRYFSSGLDLQVLTSLPPERQAAPFEAMVGAYRTLLALPKPVVAAIGGSAILGGWIIAMSADFRIMAEDGKIALSEVRLGLSPTSLLIQRMRSISRDPSLVKEMVLRGRTLRAAEALSGGFVDRVVAPEALQEECLKEAKSLAKQSPLAYASIKRALLDTSGCAAQELWTKGLSEFTDLFCHPQTKEGIEAMRDKRRPRWED